MTPFDIIKSLSKHEPWKEEFRDIYSPFLTNKYFSNSKQYLPVAEIADRITDSEQNYNFWKGMIPKNVKWVPWIKSVPEEGTKEVMEYFQVSAQKAREYQQVLNEQDKLIINNFITERRNES